MYPRQIDNIIAPVLYLWVDGIQYEIKQNISFKERQMATLQASSGRFEWDKIATFEELEKSLIQTNQLNSNWRVNKAALRKELKTLQLDYYHGFFDIKKKKDIGQKIRFKEAAIVKIESYEQYLKAHCREGMINSTIEDYQLRNSIDKKVDEFTFDQIKKELAIERSKLCIRDLAMDDDWLSYFRMFKDQIFCNHPMTEQQLLLANLSQFYCNIHEHHEKPPIAIIKDHHALDGWLEYQSVKQSTEAKSKKSNKVAGMQNQFVMVKDAKEAKAVYDSNPPAAKAAAKKVQNKIGLKLKGKNNK